MNLRRVRCGLLWGISALLLISVLTTPALAWEVPSWDEVKDAAGNAYDTVREKAPEWASQAKDKAGEAYEAAKEKAPELIDQAKDGLAQAGEKVSEFRQDQEQQFGEWFEQQTGTSAGIGSSSGNDAAAGSNASSPSQPAQPTPESSAASALMADEPAPTTSGSSAPANADTSAETAESAATTEVAEVAKPADDSTRAIAWTALILAGISFLLMLGYAVMKLFSRR